MVKVLSDGNNNFTDGGHYKTILQAFPTRNNF